MKAVIYNHSGPPEVLQMKEMPAPTPKDNEVLIKLAATTVKRYDCWVRSAHAHAGMGLLMKLYFGFPKPKQPILGTELSGVIAEVGPKVKHFKIH
jgi:NADPH:quinone reductase-like Zn-dependent oxidoreductase